MNFMVILTIAIGLALDALAVSISAGLSGRIEHRSSAIRISSHFGFFQFLMPILGWFLGKEIEPLISSLDHWVAFGLLCVVGGRMIFCGLKHEAPASAIDHTRGMPLIMISLATSIDALAVGLGFGMLQISIWYPSVVIGLVTFALSYGGARLGGHLGARFGKRMEILGGVILILIGTQILLTHVCA